MVASGGEFTDGVVMGLLAATAEEMKTASGLEPLRQIVG
jgi:hypothetical protein